MKIQIMRKVIKLKLMIVLMINFIILDYIIMKMKKELDLLIIFMELEKVII
jgi:hypothetical protein